MSLFSRSLVCLILAVVGLAGCNSATTMLDPALIGPLYVPDNHRGIVQLPPDLRRVVLLPMAGGSVASSETTMALDPIFAAALQHEDRFEVVALSREECHRALGGAEFRSTSALPHGFLAQVRELFAADAVMFLDLTVLRSHRPLALGVRAKLATTADEVRLLWNFDDVFSADDPRVVNSARRHYLISDDWMVPVDRSDAVLQSPSRYAGYVAKATFSTLPLR
jgi:hypothetical protein